MLVSRTLCFLIICFFCAILEGADNYQALEIPPLEGFSQVYPIAINSKGTVTGIMISDDENISTAFIWDKSKGSRLIPFSNKKYLHIVPKAINDRNQVVGIAMKENSKIHSFQWTEGKPASILPINLKSPLVIATSINDKGDIAGTTLLVITGHAEDENYYIPSAFLYRNHEFLIPLEKNGEDIFPLFSTGMALNEEGIVTGSYINIEDFEFQPTEDFLSALTKGDLHPAKIQNTKIFKWDGNKITKFNPFNNMHINAIPKAINKKGEIVGLARIKDLPITTSFLKLPQKEAIALDVLPEDIEFCDSINLLVSDLNDEQELIGTSYIMDEEEDHLPKPFLWTSQKGMRNLNNLLEKQSKCFYFFHAQSINENGQIIGYGLRNDYTMGGFLLEPLK